jgi:hypothetical protein
MNSAFRDIIFVNDFTPFSFISSGPFNSHNRRKFP